jgi:hypothetical protein
MLKNNNNTKNLYARSAKFTLHFLHIKQAQALLSSPVGAEKGQELAKISTNHP